MSEEVLIGDTTLPFPFPCRLSAWSVTVGSKVHKGSVVCSCVQSTERGGEGGGEGGGNETALQVKSGVVGVVQELMYSPGDIVQPGSVLVKVEKCQHDIVVFDMCADCGLNLRNKLTCVSRESAPQSVAANIMAIHDNAGIRISQQEAEVLAHKDKLRLLKTRKLTLVVDLDQTLIHTSTDPHIEPGLPDVYGFRLAGQPIVYHCRLRPHVCQFLEKLSKLYELHVFTMATKDYAAAVIDILDPEKHLFCDRIITRDEFFDPRSKALRFKSVFPCGDSMVAIIDDREDVWGRCPNLVHVKPYVFFSGTSDINAPPPLVPTSASPSPPSSTLPATPTTPRPFFGGSGVVPQGQPRPFKMRHITRQPRPVPRPPTAAQPLASDLATQSHNAKGNGTSLDQQQTSSELRQQQSPEDCRQTKCEEMDTSSDLKTHDNGRSVSGTHTSTTMSNDRGLSHKELISDTTNINNNNNNDNDREGSSGESGSDGEEDTRGCDKDERGEVEGGGIGRVEDEGGGKKKEGSSSSSSGSSSDSEDSSSSSSSSGMNDSQPQKTSSPPGEALENTESEVTGSVDNGEQKNDPEVTQVEAEDSLALKKDEKSSKVEIKDSDSFLVSLGDVLKRIHSTFYTQLSEMLGGRDISTTSDITTPDLKAIIPEMRQSVLKGAKILFTGVIPTNIPPQRSPIWNTARAFGAIVHDKLVPGLASTRPRTAMKATTHVIAGKSGTVKLKEAKRATGVKIVSPRWLWNCAEQWKWLDEREFPVEVDDGHSKEGPKEDAKEKKSKVDKTKSLSNISVKKTKENIKLETKHESRDDLPGRSSRLDSRISVSDEELEKMEAEVDAEIGSSSSSGGEEEERLGEKSSLEQSYEDTVNVTDSSAAWESRKRKHVEVDDSSSNSPNSDPFANSDSSDDDDALAALLVRDSPLT